MRLCRAAPLRASEFASYATVKLLYYYIVLSMVYSKISEELLDIFHISGIIEI